MRPRPPSRPLKLCILNEFFFPVVEGGTGQVVSDAARRLKSMGIDVEVICGSRSYVAGELLPPFEEWDGIPIHRIRYPNWNRSGVAKRSLCNLILAAKAAVRLVLRKRYDLVLVTTAPPLYPIAARAALRFRGVPYAYLIYDLEPDRTVRLGVARTDAIPVRMLRSAQRKWLNGAAAVIAIGRCMKALIAGAYGVPEEQIFIVPVGADAAVVPFLEPQPPRKGRPFQVLYSGNLGLYHDFDTLLACAKSLGGNGFEFRIVGHGAKMAEVQKRIRDEAIPGTTTGGFVPQAEYGALLGSADACFVSMELCVEGTCVPSKFYSMLAAGRPIVGALAPDSETALEIGEHECGFVVRPGDVTGLEAAFRQLRDDPALAVAMGRNARRAFEQQYTTATTVAQMHDLLISLVNPTR